MVAIYCAKFSCEHDQLPIDVCYTKWLLVKAIKRFTLNVSIVYPQQKLTINISTLACEHAYIQIKIPVKLKWNTIETRWSLVQTNNIHC